ncbi:putative methyltransferase NSUN7 isoform X2 [Amphiura filiformis]|uniref:putative methyltransferase NSUN7 isoform X2 n=1 Tax=Amphiura filiformis TaxID=82378 RepID=UPI003B21927C
MALLSQAYGRVPRARPPRRAISVFTAGDSSPSKNMDVERKNLSECIFSMHIDGDSTDVYHPIYHYASQVFASLRQPSKVEVLTRKVEPNPDPPNLPEMEEKVKRKIYDLAFSTLKYQGLLEDMLSESGYYSYDAVIDENHSIIMVILCDMLNRKFVKRPYKKGEACIPYVQELEEDLLSFSTKLNASLARNRIKFQASSIECLLPENIRQRDEKGSNMPTYAWVNQLKTSVSEVTEALREEGFSMSKTWDGIQDMENTFALDGHCPNVLVFHSGCKEDLTSHELVQEGKLVLQDKTTCLGPHSVKQLLNEGDDIIHTNVGSGWTTAHVASLTTQDQCTVYGFGVKGQSRVDQVNGQMRKLEIENVKLIQDSIFDVQHTDPRFKNVKVVLVTPQDSRSGITNPVEYMLQEGDDASLLKELSRDNVDAEKLDELVSKHMDLLKHVMKFPKVQAVVYTTCSVFSEENENVVTKVMDYSNNARLPSKMPFRMIPPLIPLTPRDLDTQKSTKFLTIEPSEVMGGCFVAVLSREDEALSAADIIARAAAKGLCDGPASKKDDDDDTEETTESSKLKKKSSRTTPRGYPTAKKSVSARYLKGYKGGQGSAEKVVVKSSSSGQQKKVKPVRTASQMFAHHFSSDKPAQPDLQPYGVPLTQATISRMNATKQVRKDNSQTQQPKPFL